MALSEYDHIDLQTLSVLRADTLDLLKKVSDLGTAHTINGRSVALPSRDELLSQLSKISRAIASKRRRASSLGGVLHSNYASFKGY